MSKIKRRHKRAHEGKQIHRSKLDAQAHANSLYLSRGAKVYVYRCPVHSFGHPRHWHVGH